MADCGYDDWSHVYDLLYEGCYGQIYGDMTAQHLSLVPSSASRVLDAGAGTGRLTIPLAQRSVHVTALEPSQGMLHQLSIKVVAAGVEDRVTLMNAALGSIDVIGDGSAHDCAVCLFSTIHHLTTESELSRALRTLAQAVHIGGRVLIGVHPPAVFEQFHDGLVQDVYVPALGGLVRWSQSATASDGSPVLDATCTIGLPDGTRLVDPLRLRPWTREQITVVAADAGLRVIRTTFIGSEDVLIVERR